MTQPPDLARIAAQLALDLHPIGSALIDCASRIAYIKPLLPPQGELAHEFRELVKTLAWIETTYRNADEKFTAAAYLIDHDSQSGDA